MAAKPRMDAGGTGSGRAIRPVVGAGGILAIVVIAVLFLALRGADEQPSRVAGLATDEQPSLDQSLYGKTPCGGTPETTLILCYRGEGGELSVYLWRDGGLQPLVDSDEPGDYIGVDLCPDQTRLALTRSHGAEPNGYWVEIMDLETRHLRPIAGTSTCWQYGWPDWSTDGERLSVRAMAPADREATIVIAADGEILERDPAREWPVC